MFSRSQRAKEDPQIDRNQNPKWRMPCSEDVVPPLCLLWVIDPAWPRHSDVTEKPWRSAQTSPAGVKVRSAWLPVAWPGIDASIWLEVCHTGISMRFLQRRVHRTGIHRCGTSLRGHAAAHRLTSEPKEHTSPDAVPVLEMSGFPPPPPKMTSVSTLRLGRLVSELW
jgi:hypothetical protein